MRENQNSIAFLRTRRMYVSTITCSTARNVRMYTRMHFRTKEFFNQSKCSHYTYSQVSPFTSLLINRGTSSNPITYELSEYVSFFFRARQRTKQRSNGRCRCANVQQHDPWLNGIIYATSWHSSRRIRATGVARSYAYQSMLTEVTNRMTASFTRQVWLHRDNRYKWDFPLVWNFPRMGYINYNVQAYQLN